MRKLLLGSLLSLMAVSASAEHGKISNETMTTPNIGEINTSSIGDSILEQMPATKAEAIYFSEPQSINKTTITRGFYRKSIDSGDYVQYDSYRAPNGGQIGSLGSLPWFFVRKSDNSVCLSSEWKVKPNEKTCTPLKFEAKDWVYPARDAIEQRLIYNGKSGSKIKIGYREFINGMARPSFSNDIEYDLSDSKQIGYKGALIEVTDANNQDIKYKVLKGFK